MARRLTVTLYEKNAITMSVKKIFQNVPTYILFSEVRFLQNIDDCDNDTNNSMS